MCCVYMCIYHIHAIDNTIYFIKEDPQKICSSCSCLGVTPLLLLKRQENNKIGGCKLWLTDNPQGQTQPQKGTYKAYAHGLCFRLLYPRPVITHIITESLDHFKVTVIYSHNWN